MRVLDHDGAELPALVEHDGRSVTWLARDVPSLGWRAYRLVLPATTDAAGNRCAAREIANEHYRLAVDPARGGGVVVADPRRPTADRRRPGGQRAGRLRGIPVAPDAGRGPVAPAAQGAGGLLVGIAGARCRPTTARSVSGWSCTAGSATLLRYTQTLTLWRGVAGWTAAPPSTSSPARTACCGCAGRARCRAPCRSARWATPSSGAVSRCCTTGAASVDTARAPVDAGQPGLRLVRVVVGGAGARRRRACGRCRWPRWCRRPRRCPARWRAT